MKVLPFTLILTLLACTDPELGKQVGATSDYTVTLSGTTATGSATNTYAYAGPILAEVGGPCVGQSQDGSYVGPTQVRCVDVSCTNDDWTWTLLADGWTRGGTLYIHYASGGVDEAHDIGSVGYAETFWWDALVEELYATSFVHSVSTGAACGLDGPTNMTVAAEVWDYNTDTLAQCVVFGVDTAYYTDQAQFSGCDVWTW